MEPIETITRVAIASSDGRRVNRNLEEVDYLVIYDVSKPTPRLAEIRKIPPGTIEKAQWDVLIPLLKGCSLLLAGDVGAAPKAVLKQNGIRVRTARGQIVEVLSKVDIAVTGDDDVPILCNERCHGNGRGCG